jgi:hypothetical protein
MREKNVEWLADQADNLKRTGCMCLPTDDVESAHASSQTARVAQLCMDWQFISTT